jgi:hypothetical protein
MDTCILQLDSRLFRLVYFQVRATGDLDSIEVGSERVDIGDSIETTGAISRTAWIQGLAVAAGLIERARERLPRAHVVVVVSDAVVNARNAEGFFEALRRRSGVGAEMLLPSEILGLLTARNTADEPVSSTKSPDPSRASNPMRSRTRSSLPCPSSRP